MKSLSWIYFGEQGLSCTHNLIGEATPHSKMAIFVFCASLNAEQFFSWLARCDRTIIPSLHHHHLCLPPTQPPEPHGQLGRGLLPWLSPSSSLSSTVKFHLKYPSEREIFAPGRSDFCENIPLLENPFTKSKQLPAPLLCGTKWIALVSIEHRGSILTC